MVFDAAETICRQVRAVFEYAPTEELVEEYHEHNRTVVEMMLRDGITTADLTAAETLALKALFMPVHARLKHRREGNPPTLRIVS